MFLFQGSAMSRVKNKSIPVKRFESPFDPAIAEFASDLGLDGGMRMEQRIFPGKDFYSKISKVELDNLKCYLLDIGPHEACITPLKKTEFNKHSWTIMLQIEGEMLQEADGVLFKLAPGDWKISRVPTSFKVWCVEPMQQLSVILPEEEISRFKKMKMPLPKEIFSQKDGLSKLFFDFVLSTFNEATELRQEVKSDLSQMLLQLLWLTLSESKNVRKALTSQEILRERIKLLVTRRFSDPTFTIDEIASKLKCSKRYLHMIFRDNNAGDSLGQYILLTRLKKSKAELIKPENSQLAVSQIAFTCGFNDASYFSRAFKKHFELTPSEYRQFRVQ
ncbi:helix-turn-helix transcriptional regulator [Gammaproteobacteria bacterium AH-315-E17]|nr:helix-turn-helix transcriptional regulator [Gammaproteobacteria bacterium AH-315-E17]